MDHRLQALIGLNSLKQLPRLFDSFLGYPSSHLLDEVMKGRCTVVVNCDDTVERIVRVAALLILHNDGSVVTQLGHFQGSSFTAACATRLNPLTDAVTIILFRRGSVQARVPAVPSEDAVLPERVFCKAVSGFFRACRLLGSTHNQTQCEWRQLPCCC